MNKFQKSLYYGIVSLVPSVIIFTVIFLILHTTYDVSLTDTIAKATTSQQHYNFSHVLYFFDPFIDGKGLTVVGSVLFILLIASFIWFFISWLKILNPTFKLKNLKGLKQYITISSKFILAFVGIIIIITLLEIFFNESDFQQTLLAILSLLIYLSFTFFWILYWHQDGFIGNFRDYELKKNSSFRLWWRSSFPEGIKKLTLIIKIIISDFLIFLTGFLILILVARETSRLANIPLDTSFFSGETSYFYFMIAALPAFFILPLRYIFFENIKKTNNNILLKSLPIALVFLLLIINYFIMFNQSKSLDAQKFIVNETNVVLGNHVNKNTAIVFNPEPNFYTYDAETSTRFRLNSNSDDESSIFFLDSLYSYNLNNELNVQCNQESIDKIKSLENYLESKNYRSLLAPEYFDILRSCYHHNWDTNKYSLLNKLAFEKNNSIISGIIYTSPRTSWAIFDPISMNEFQSFTQNKETYFGINVSRRIAKKFLYYGYSNESKEWFVKSGEDISKIDFREKYLDGTIQGKISSDIQFSNIRIGLFTDKVDETTTGLSIPGIDSKKLVASVPVDDNGRFVFSNVVEGKYSLGVLLKEYNLSQENLLLDQAIPEMEIGVNQPNFNLDTINISIKE